MRMTTLKRTNLAVAGILIVVAVGLGIVRNTLVPHPKDAEALDQLGDRNAQLSQIASLGGKLFNDKGCFHCHAVDSTGGGRSLGLKGLFQRKTLPVSDRPVTVENVAKQLKEPYRNMPSYADRLTDEERDQIIAYLKTL